MFMPLRPDTKYPLFCGIAHPPVLHNLDAGTGASFRFLFAYEHGAILEDRHRNVKRKFNMGTACAGAEHMNTYHINFKSLEIHETNNRPYYAVPNLKGL